MTKATETKGTKRPYHKPHLEQVRLVIEEAVLQACKSGRIAVTGPRGDFHLCVGVVALCSTIGS